VRCANLLAAVPCRSVAAIVLSLSLRRLVVSRASRPAVTWAAGVFVVKMAVIERLSWETAVRPSRSCTSGLGAGK
jgi:hypothetical protein